jgi:prepilin-type N-terminal cleavage/methylation domain-containing protein
MQRITRNHRGVTLVELMVALAVGGIAMAGIYGVYNAQMKAHVTQSAVVDNQQNLRNAIYFIQGSLRMAGFDPSRVVRTSDASRTDANKRLGLLTATNLSNLCTAISCNNPGTVGTGASAIAFTLDWNGDGSGAGIGVIERLDTEVVAFRHNAANRTIERFGAASGWREVAENIASLEFAYFDQNGLAITNLETKAQLDQVRSVQVTVVSVPPRQVTGAAGNKAESRLSALVKLRNSGLL